jgi:archaeal chaperonin
MSQKDILPEDTQRTVGKNAQRNNILAGKLVAETVRTTLGPKGMDKMLVNQLGDVVVTNDGVTILEEIAIEHPTAKMIVEIAKTQEEEVGDGTTTAVIIAGELLKNAEKLLDNNIHPTVITKGYRLAATKCLEILREIALPIKVDDKSMLHKIARTAMTGKGAEIAKDSLAEIAVDAVINISKTENGVTIIDTDNIRIETQTGSGVEDSRLIEGLIIDKARVHSGMPKNLDNPKILLYNAPIEIKDTETDAKITITNPSQMDAFLAQEEKMIRVMVDKIIKSGANVVFCQKGIDDLAQHFLAKAGIMALRRVKKSDIDMLAKATGGRIITNLNDISPSDLGSCGIIEEVKEEYENVTHIKECKNKDIVSLILNAGTEHVVEEIKRAMEDAIGDLASAIKVGFVVAGAGAIEIELARRTRIYAESLPGREQLAVRAFADSIEAIPVTLAENAGLDPIDVITSLKAAHDKNQIWAGINVFTGKIIDAWKSGIIEPLKIKTQALSSASEVANMVLRIDDIIAAGAPSEQQMPNMNADY